MGSWAGIWGGIPGERGGSMTGGYGGGRCFSHGGTVYDVGCSLLRRLAVTCALHGGSFFVYAVILLHSMSILNDQRNYERKVYSQKSNL